MGQEKRITDREKRSRLDAQLRKEFPEDTPQQIRQRREEYLQNKYGTGTVMVKPQPEDRQNAPQKLTVERIAEEALRDGHFYEGGPIVTFILLIVPMLVCVLAVVTGISFEDKLVWWNFVFAVLLSLLGIYQIRKDRQRKKELQELILKRKFRLVRYTVVDMDLDSGLDYDARTEYHVHLISLNTSTPWICECTKLQYETTREGDAVYLVYPDESKEHCFLFSEAGWILDSTISALTKSAVDA